MLDVVRGECEAKEGGGGENHLSRSHHADKKKSIFMQLLEYPIPPLTAAALQMIICKRPVPHFDNHLKGKKSAFFRPITMR